MNSEGIHRICERDKLATNSYVFELIPANIFKHVEKIYILYNAKYEDMILYWHIGQTIN